MNLCEPCEKFNNKILATHRYGWDQVPVCRYHVDAPWSTKPPEVKTPIRPDWDTYFLNICVAVAQRADCRRAQHGCVIVQGNRIVSTGYNGSPSGGPSCLAGECSRGLLSNEECASLSSYENCVALHAEQNAIAYSNRADCVDATLYVTGPQCDMCEKLTRAAGIRRIVWPDGQKWV